MNTINYKDQILEKAQALGYLGFDGKHFHFEGGYKTTSADAAIKEMGFPDVFRSDAQCKDLLFEYPTLKSKVRMWLRNKATPEKENGNQEVEETLNNDAWVDQVKDIVLYKTPAKMKHDTHSIKSAGYSVVAIHAETKTIIDLNKMSPEALLSMKGWTREEFGASNKIKTVVPKFNPICPDLTFEAPDEFFGSNNNITYLNTAIPPFWLKNPEFRDVPAAITPFIKKLLNHLFPEKEELEKVLDWCHHAISGRNGTILCLAGPRGTGKSTFADILGTIIGTEYYETVGEAALREKFNSQLHNKRLAVFEEVSLKESDYVNKLKAWCNDRISMESKGNDATTVDNWASIMFLMNDVSNLVIQYQERRFSVPRVAVDNLIKVFSESEIAEFKSGISKQDFDVLKQVASFGKFLLAREPKFSNQAPIKGDYYEYVADLNMKEWESELREYILNNGEIDKPIPITNIFPPTDMKVGQVSKYPRKRTTIEAWLNDYQYKAEALRLGKVVDYVPPKSTKARPTLMEEDENLPKTRTSRTYAVLPNPELLKKYGKKYENSYSSMRDEDIL